MPKIISSKNDMLDFFEQGKRLCSTLGIGSEWEMFIYNKQDGGNITYEGKNGTKELLKQIAKTDSWQEVTENGNIIGLQGKLGSVSLEPGLQLEFSSSVRQNLHDINDDNTNFINKLYEITNKMGLGIFFSGFHPFLTPNTTTLAPKERYNIMYNYMPKVGSLGRHMMKNTTTTQTNVSYNSQEHMSDILVLFTKIAPLITALFANSAILEGKISPYQSFRANIWQHTDNNRAGLKKFIFKNNAISFENYLDFALDVPMYFIIRNGKYIDLTGKSFKDFLNKNIKELNDVLGDYEVSEDDFTLHLSCIFPEVRLKNYLEIRSADSGHLPFVVALSAFVAALSHNCSALKESFNLVKDWSYEETLELLKAVPKLGLNAQIKGKKLSYFAKVLVDIALYSLKARNVIVNNTSEELYLAPLQAIVTGNSPTQALKQVEFFNKTIATNPANKLNYLNKLSFIKE